MPRQVDHDERRAEIVQAVWSLIAREGIEAVTMRRVAAEAGVSVGRIQHYFAGRGDLVRVSAQAMLAGAEALYDARPPSEALRFAVEHVVPMTDAQRVGATVWLAYVAASVSDPELARLLAEAKRGQEDEVARLLAEAGGGPGGDPDAHGRGGGGPDACRERARALVAIADGLAVRVLVGDLTGDEALAVVREALPAEDGG